MLLLAGFPSYRMRLLELTLPTPEENLALDEALLDEAEAADAPCEVLRLWESRRPFVVLGRGSHAAQEVNLDYCRAHDIPVLRRTSGGAAVLAAPGSLMYALVLSYLLRPELRMLDVAHRFVLGAMAEALRPLAPGIEHRGTSDLAIGSRKCSGNSLRCKRRNFLYHGTLLYALDISLMEKCLAMPPRQPDYREGRAHDTFVTNLGVAKSTLQSALVTAWDVRRVDVPCPAERVRTLVDARYSQSEWNNSSL
jgi:lipoate-protein ligase A